MKRVLLTGATGFVGSVLTRRLLREGHDVHLLVRPGYSPWRIEAVRRDVSLHEIDLGDAEATGSLVAQLKPDWVFHLAVYGAYSSQTDLRRMVDTNIIATMNLVNACLRTDFEAFVNTGSSSEYGFKTYPPAENDWLDPSSYYAIFKATATMFCRYTARQRQVHMPTLRLYSVYGPYEEPTRLIPTLMVRGLRGELPPLVNPDIARDYVYVEDVSEAYLLAATLPDRQEAGAVYNVGTGVQTALREVVDVARQQLPISVDPQWGTMPDRHWDTTAWVANSQKIRDELGWSPRYSFEQGFCETLAWFRDNPQMRAFYSSRQANG